LEEITYFATLTTVVFIGGEVDAFVDGAVAVIVDTVACFDAIVGRKALIFATVGVGIALADVAVGIDEARKTRNDFACAGYALGLRTAAIALDATRAAVFLVAEQVETVISGAIAVIVDAIALLGLDDALVAFGGWPIGPCINQATIAGVAILRDFTI